MKGKETDHYIYISYFFELPDYLSLFFEFVPVQSYVLKTIYTQNTPGHALFFKNKHACISIQMKGIERESANYFI